jgi:hypothetical protein
MRTSSRLGEDKDYHPDLQQILLFRRQRRPRFFKPNVETTGKSGDWKPFEEALAENKKIEQFRRSIVNS